jgi:hypothetical protein
MHDADDLAALTASDAEAAAGASSRENLSIGRARVTFELLDELDRHFDIIDLDRRFARYASLADLDPWLLHAVGADRFPPAIHLVEDSQ